MLLAAGCATVASDRPVSVEGRWVGVWTNVDDFLSTTAGVGAGPVRAVLEQRGRLVSGSLQAPGLRATISAAADNEGFSGTLVGQTGQGSAGVPITMRVTADEMEGTVNRTPLVLRRKPQDARRPVPAHGRAARGQVPAVLHRLIIEALADGHARTPSMAWWRETPDAGSPGSVGGLEGGRLPTVGKGTS